MSATSAILPNLPPKIQKGRAPSAFNGSVLSLRTGFSGKPLKKSAPVQKPNNQSSGVVTSELFEQRPQLPADLVLVFMMRVTKNINQEKTEETKKQKNSRGIYSFNCFSLGINRRNGKTIYMHADSFFKNEVNKAWRQLLYEYIAESEKNNLTKFETKKDFEARVQEKFKALKVKSLDNLAHACANRNEPQGFSVDLPPQRDGTYYTLCVQLTPIHGGLPNYTPPAEEQS